MEKEDKKLDWTKIQKNPFTNQQIRLDMLVRSEKDAELRDLLWNKCANDITYFVNYFMWTFDPRKETATLPFITYPFQDDYLKKEVWLIDNDKDSATEKSRDMGASWMWVAIAVWGFTFKKWSGLYGSYKDTYVDTQGNMDSFFERCRFVINKLPSWMKPYDTVFKYSSISSKSNSCEIAGDIGENFGTGGRRKWVLMDEFAIWQFDKTAWRKTRDVTRSRHILATPEGRFNVYGMIMTNHPDYSHLDIHKFRLHWKLHPEKTQEWYDQQCKRATSLEIAKELDISYDDSVTGAVYKDFVRTSRFGKYDYNPSLPVYVAWDFGRDAVAMIWFQKDMRTNAIYIVDSYKNENKLITFYAAFITGKPTQNHIYNEEDFVVMKNHETWVGNYAGHVGDPYNTNNKSVVTESTVATELEKYGIYIETKRDSTLYERIKKTELAMRRIFVNDSLNTFIQSIIQSRYPSATSQSTSEKVQPIHDDNSHYRTALEYLCDYEEMIGFADYMQQREREEVFVGGINKPFNSIF